MAVRSVDFLPEIFQTPVNRQFLTATLDQLAQEPDYGLTQGFIGRRIGPGVNANDNYVIEPDRIRTDYQLEPGVVITNPENNNAEDAITYPGILDNLRVNGTNTDNADRLFSSQYYVWDPMIDFDKFVNFSEYYWLPNGPDAVSVFGSPILAQVDIQVTRRANSYTFDLAEGANPTITLLRGGSYQFKVEQNLKRTQSLRVTNRGTSAYVIDFAPNPNITLVRGNTYEFELSLGGDFPFWIKTRPSLGTTNVFNQGVTNNGSARGTVVFTVPFSSPDRLYYAAENVANMQGELTIVDPVPGSGPKFFIQAAPGVDGAMPETPNISSRDVLGVENNGIDLGTVTFNVPDKTAQNFYYTLPEIDPVDLVTELPFNAINNAYVDDFLAQYGGIDGVQDLRNRTVVFVQDPPIRDEIDANLYGWVRTLGYSPNPDNDILEPGDYDNPSYGTSVPIIPKSERFVVWNINYQTDLFGRIYMTLTFARSVSVFDRFRVKSGVQYSNTNWFKNADSVFERIPLLTAALDTLYYQDSLDPSMNGEIRLIDPNQAATIYIEDILGKPQYTSPNGVKFTNGLKVQFFGDVVPASYLQSEWYVEGVGTSIRLLNVEGFVNPERYTGTRQSPFDSTPYDSTNYDVEGNIPLKQDYITINRSSLDRNAWSRYNRWFHREVLEITGEYTNQPVLLDQTQRAKRPIIEFRAGLKLYNFGTDGKKPITVIDFNTIDAFSNVNGSTQYNIDGINLLEGDRVIFAADQDPLVRNRIYTVQFISPDSLEPLIDQPIINLVPADDADPEFDNTVVCLSGLTLQGLSFWYNGTDWVLSQLKTSANQPPLFDIFDVDGFSIGDQDRYPSSSFSGTKIFSYAPGSGPDDPVLGFPIKYLTISNVGDIVFDNNYYTDTFLYVIDRTSREDRVSQGFVREYSDRTIFRRRLGWQTAVDNSHQYQQFRFVYDGSSLQLDIRVNGLSISTNSVGSLPSIKVYAGNRFVPPNRYTFTTTLDTTVIRLLDTYPPGEIIEVLAYSEQVSKAGFYQVPINLENNPFNVNSPEFTLGTIRSHYETIGENILGWQGPINGSNNSRDLGNIIPYGLNILQQSSSMMLPGFFMRRDAFDVNNAIIYNSNEYVKFKNKLMDAVANNSYNNETVAEILTQAMAQVNIGQSETSPFYWSDMLPAGAVFESSVYNYTAISTPVFDTQQVYDFRSSNYLGLNVFVNNRLLQRGVEFNTVPDAASIVITINLVPGDVILIQEFPTTLGNFVPNTPTKMGLYPAFRPQIYLDNTYQTPTTIILGHDGSKTVAFGDIRDDVLLQFETRIYNNLKVRSQIPIEIIQVIPGEFRTTKFTKQQVQDILDQDFLSWAGWNKLDYRTQDYISDDPFTWNYRQAGNRLTGRPLLGNWRGIYLDIYDTITPHTTPWQMLGFTQRPDWWNARYGTAPYTSGNLVLWDDLEAGRIAEPGRDRIDPRYARPGLSQIIPVDSKGDLLPPIEACVGAYDPTAFRQSWRTGDYGPVEYSWRASSAYPFAVMRLMSLLQSAQFYNLFADRDRYVYDEEFDQYLYDRRYRLDSKDMQIYGSGTSKASYINWSVDYNSYTGNLESNRTLRADLANLDVRLVYRMAGFSNKQYMRLFLEKPSPNSVNTSLLLPDDSYDLLLYKNVPFDEINYSSVIVQRTEQGYAVFGYSITQPYFPILQSQPTGLLRSVSAGNLVVRVPAQYSDLVVNVPYGFVFVNETVMVDFLLSYGALLERQGMSFTTVENGFVMDWQQMAAEFLYWSQQGWAVGSVINLNAAAVTLNVAKPRALVDDILQLNANDQPQDQNRNLINANDLIIERIGNEFKMSSQNQQTISSAYLRFVNYEHMIVLRNSSLFGDLVYSPATGARQGRLRLSAQRTTEWNGQLDARGFILNQDNIRDWVPNRKYSKGEIVNYKNTLFAAARIVQPKLLFDNNDWIATEYRAVQLGLLPNIPNKANQLINSYNINSANLETDNDLLSYGLTGFRPRQYMSSLDLNDVSQLNVYRQFIGDKGTIGAVRLLTNADLGKEAAEYEIYENWAILSGIYGAQDNRRYVDLRLQENLLTSNQSTIQIIEPTQQSLADQTVLVNDIWSSSYPVTSTDFLPTKDFALTTKSLPSAGYVSLDDVDVTVFDLSDPQALDPFIDQIGVGSSIWVAAVNPYDWNIYRGTVTPGNLIQSQDNLDGTLLMTNSRQHGLRAGDVVIIKQFDTSINGVYRVRSVPSLTTFLIDLTLPASQQITVTGVGLILRLQTMRVRQASDAVNLPYVDSIKPGGRIWVDNNGTGQWQVLEKTSPIRPYSTIFPRTSDFDSLFGTAVSQRADNLAALAGSPNSPTTQGSITNYLLQSNADLYLPGLSLDLEGATGVIGYGASVAVGNNTWAVAGAPASLGNQGYVGVLKWMQDRVSFQETQLLMAPDQPGPSEFGSSVAISDDERWIYIGAPAANAVYAYGLQTVEPQSVSYTGDGQTATFGVNNLQFDYDTQLIVLLDGTEQVLGSQWLLINQSVVFSAPVEIGKSVLIARRESVQLDKATFLNISSNDTTGLGENAVFNINLVRGLYDVVIINGGRAYSVGEVITIPGTVFGGQTPANDCEIEVIEVGFIGDIEEVMVTGTFVPMSGLPDVFPIQQYLISADELDSITVRVNGQLWRPKIDYEMENADSTLPDSTGDDRILVFVNSPPLGAKIEVTGGDHYIFSGIITAPGLNPDARFGSSLACGSDGRQIIVGAPGQTVDGKAKAGAAYVFSRHVQRFLVENPLQTTYTTLANLIAPTSTKLNNLFIENSNYYLNAGFTAGINSVTMTNNLSLGDEIEIETNQFLLVQTIQATGSTLEASAGFGSSVDLCRNNCSLYAGSPGWGGLAYIRQGRVTREVNQSRVYGVTTSTIDNPPLLPGDTIRINNVEISVPAVPNNTIEGLAALINSNLIPNAQAEVANSRLVITVRNPLAAIPGNQLSVLPGVVGTAFQNLGFDTFVFTQDIDNPRPSDLAQFGYDVNVSNDTSLLLVGAPGATAVQPITFDQARTTFDFDSTEFSGFLPQSGAVYQYDFFNSANSSAMNPGKFIFGQQIYNNLGKPQDNFGVSISSINGIILIGSPGTDFDSNISNEGSVQIYRNADQIPTWAVIHQESPRVDVDLINSVSLYDRLITTVNQYLDFFDPLQGKILGACARNIDFIGAIDPANYNVTAGTSNNNAWYEQQLGQIWWDTTRVRFIDPDASDIFYATKRWGQVFPGSELDVYQWTASREPPSNYTGEGTPYNITEYSVSTVVSDSGIIETTYYFWVRGVTTIATRANKTLSVQVLSQYLADPQGSGISYLVPLSASAVALVNSKSYISADDTILHIEFDQKINDSLVHTEFELIADGREKSRLPSNLFVKLKDSLCGINEQGKSVPDPRLPMAMRYGVLNRPRQGMFVDRFTALKNLVEFTNRVMRQVPFAELNLSFSLLNSREPEPSISSGAWNTRVENLEQLSWQNINIVPLGYRYLVATDALNNGLWTIYTVVTDSVTNSPSLLLTNVQSYDTRRYWSFIDWYAQDYDSAIQPRFEVKLFADLSTVADPYPGLTVRVTTNAQGKWEIYRYELAGRWQRVGVQQGTIEISDAIWDYALGRVGYDSEVFDAQYFDNSPVVETRRIVDAVFTEIFVGELDIFVNQLTILLFNYILSEQEAPDWLMKTSLIDVTHRIRQLIPYATYRRDNQDFVLQYLQEVKPYHVQVRQFDLQYSGFDEFTGDITDFDLPSRFDTALDPASFQSPVLSINGQFDSSPAAVPPDAAIWQQWPYNQWFGNYLLQLNFIDVIDRGSGYTSRPTVSIQGLADRLGTAVASINSLGQLVDIEIVDPGENYYSTPTIVISGGNGQGARAVARMSNDLVRNFSIGIKFDRYQYRQDFLEWEPNVTYDNGSLVRYIDSIWQANSPDSSGVNTPEFEISDWILIPASRLSGVDRTMGFYIAAKDQPGRSLPLLIDGVDYPGVQVQGVSFLNSTGFDRDPYDSEVFDNYEIGPEGLPTYSNSILDTILNSQYLDSLLGTRPSDIITDGGAYVDTYSSHAPEELVPGSEFDTLDFRVYTRPGADWDGRGHGFAIASQRFIFTPVNPNFDFSQLISNPITVQLTNVTQQRDLNLGFDFTVDWVTQTLTLINNASTDDVIMVRVFQLGGGNQLYRVNYIGDQIGDQVIIPVSYDEIQEFAVFVNGVVTTDYFYEDIGLGKTLLRFPVTYTASDYLAITAIGVTPVTPNMQGPLIHTWSDPQTQLFTIVDPNVVSYTLTNSLQGSNRDMMIVTRNGLRLRPSESIEHYADGSIEYLLPTRGGYSQGLIADNEVRVYLNDVLQQQGTQYQVVPWDGSTLRSIEFIGFTPTLGERVVICVSTRAQYFIDGNQLVFKTGSIGVNLLPGDEIAVTTWNDTSEQFLLTKVFGGPITRGIEIFEGFDQVPFDSGVVLNGPGTFDWSTGTTVTENDFNLGRPPPINAERLWVNYNGNRLVNGIGFSLQTIDDQVFVILPFVISALDVLSVTMCTNIPTPDAMAFRIFQDMRGAQAVFRITVDNTTELVQELTANSDIAYLKDASKLGGPDVANNVWGVFTVNAERIMYRYIDLANNTVSGLLRGTAGTAAADHDLGSIVIDMSSGSMLPAPYEDYLVFSNFYSDGRTDVFVANNINLQLIDSTIVADESLRVFVGGRQLLPSEYILVNENPATVQLYIIPPVGVEITLAVLRGTSWYQPGFDTPSNGVPLQLTQTPQAKFLRGE
jgi:hypothetical protein